MLCANMTMGTDFFPSTKYARCTSYVLRSTLTDRNKYADLQREIGCILLAMCFPVKHCFVKIVLQKVEIRKKMKALDFAMF